MEQREGARVQTARIWLAIENGFHYCFQVTFTRTSFATFLLASWLPLTGGGCGDDLSEDGTAADDSTSAGTTSDEPATSTDPATTTTADPDSSGDDGETDADTDEPTTDGTGGTDRELGQTPNVLCEGAVLDFQIIVDENASGAADLTTITEAYVGAEGEGSALQQFVQTYGGLLGRVEAGVLVDDAAILDALASGTDADLIDVETRVLLLVSKAIRARIADVAGALPDADRDPSLLYAEWDDAYCYFDGIVRAHAEAADALGLELEATADDIQSGFEWGHGGIESDKASFAIDEWSVPAAKQVVEKSLFRVYDRLIIDLATRAQMEDDPLLARRALGLFQILEDRLQGRNTPGINIIEADLSGQPMNIEPSSIRRELDVAWIKRTRRYTSGALDDGTVGTPIGFTGANEGRTYAKVVIPSMTAALDGFDGEAYLDLWDQWIDAVEADDFEAAQAASDALTAPNCEMQAILGIAECTSGDDEPAPKR